MSTPVLLLVALAGLCLTFSVVFKLARRLDNYGVVDIAWSYAFGAVAIYFALAAPGWPWRRALIASLVLMWSLRLGTHLYWRVMSHHPKEDGRYQELRKTWSAGFAGKMFRFFQLQAASVLLLSAPFFLAARNPAPEFHAIEIVGAVLWLVAITGEAVADAQLAAFKRDPARHGGVCDAGLWRYSRHPNYFFEWLVWVAYFVFALGSPHGWLGIIGPASILYLLLRVTGIPMTEEQSLRTKGDAYRRYQETTSAFVPWFPKPTARVLS